MIPFPFTENGRDARQIPGVCCGLVPRHGEGVGLTLTPFVLGNEAGAHKVTCTSVFGLGPQTDLGSISSEIQSLQDQSHSMNIKLRNRQVGRSTTSGVKGW